MSSVEKQQFLTITNDYLHGYFPYPTDDLLSISDPTTYKLKSIAHICRSCYKEIWKNFIIKLIIQFSGQISFHTSMRIWVWTLKEISFFKKIRILVWSCNLRSGWSKDRWILRACLPHFLHDTCLKIAKKIIKWSIWGLRNSTQIGSFTYTRMHLNVHVNSKYISVPDHT